MAGRWWEGRESSREPEKGRQLGKREDRDGTDVGPQSGL